MASLTRVRGNVGQGNGLGDGVACTVALGAAPSSSNVLVLRVGCFLRDRLSLIVTDDQSNTWTQQVYYRNASARIAVAIYTCVSPAASNPTVSVKQDTASGSNLGTWYVSTVIEEYSGQHATLIECAGTSGDGSGTAPTVNLADSANDCLKLGVVTWNTGSPTGSAGSGYTIGADTVNDNSVQAACCIYRNCTGADSVDPLWALSSSDSWFAAAVAIRAAAASGATGTLSATEGADTASLAGAVAVTGTLAATEGADTATFDGTSAGISGTIAATESADTADITGAVENTVGGGGTFPIYGDLAATEGADTATIAGAVAITGSLAATESADTAAITGAVPITGTLVATESADTASINAGTGVNGSLAAAESADTFAATGAVAVTGTLAAAESADIAEVSGAVGSLGITGAFAATEAADTAEVTGTVPIIGTLAATEAADTALLNGGSGVFGSVAATEAADTAEMAGTVGAAAITGTLAATEAEDTASVSGTVPVLGSFDIIEASDTFSAAGQILVTGTLAATESADTAIFSTLAQLAVSIAHTRRIGARTTIFAGRRIGPRRIQGD